MDLIEHRLDGIDAYVAYFSARPLPVLKHTVRELEHLRAEEDSVSARRLAAVVLGDPLMAMRVITFLEERRRQSQNHDITTIDRAIMMMGVSPFFQAFSELPVVEDQLAGHPRALLGLLKVINRARRAAHFARDWAIARHDLDVEEITLGALLREAAEILCWSFAPALALEVQTAQIADRSLRSTLAQEAVFGCSAVEIQQRLIFTWRLPELLLNLIDESHGDNPRVRNIMLAGALARHSERGWDDPALPDDFDAVCRLLHIGIEPLLKRLGVPPEFAIRYLSEPDGPETAAMPTGNP
ncbi:MAG: HDOD domain-containing protein [Rhodocyclaceae bacterium]|nr:HDOD domain-containing protein [Rhodocyclaceae bacterium]